MADAEGYKEDVVALPTEGLDGKRYGNGLTDPGLTNKFEGMDGGIETVTEVTLTIAKGNDFPRQTGHDSLPDDVVPLT